MPANADGKFAPFSRSTRAYRRAPVPSPHWDNLDHRVAQDSQKVRIPLFIKRERGKEDLGRVGCLLVEVAEAVKMSAAEMAAEKHVAIAQRCTLVDEDEKDAVEGEKLSGANCDDRNSNNNTSTDSCSRPPLAISMLISIPHTEHSHVIGQGGRAVQTVTADTGCRVHFGALTCTREEQRERRFEDKSSEVFIRGSLANVEKARSQLRDLSPMSMWFPLISMKDDVTMSELVGVRNLGTRFGFPMLRISVFGNVSLLEQSPRCVIRGTCEQEMAIVNACRALRLLLIKPDADVHFYSRMEMNARKQNSLIGPDSVHMKAIAIETECIFHYPQTAVVDGVTSIAMQAKHPFQIVVARKCILGLQSVQLRFPLPPTEGQSSEEVDRIVHAMLDGDEQLKGVTMKTIPQRENLLYSKLMMTSTTADGQIAVVDTIERYISKAYGICERLLQMADGGSSHVAHRAMHVVEYDFMQHLDKHLRQATVDKEASVMQQSGLMAYYTAVPPPSSPQYFTVPPPTTSLSASRIASGMAAFAANGHHGLIVVPPAGTFAYGHYTAVPVTLMSSSKHSAVAGVESSTKTSDSTTSAVSNSVEKFMQVMRAFESSSIQDNGNVRGGTKRPGADNRRSPTGDSLRETIAKPAGRRQPLLEMNRNAPTSPTLAARVFTRSMPTNLARVRNVHLSSHSNSSMSEMPQAELGMHRKYDHRTTGGEVAYGGGTSYAEAVRASISHALSGMSMDGCTTTDVVVASATSKKMTASIDDDERHGESETDSDVFETTIYDCFDGDEENPVTERLPPPPSTVVNDEERDADAGTSRRQIRSELDEPIGDTRLNVQQQRHLRDRASNTSDGRSTPAAFRGITVPSAAAFDTIIRLRRSNAVASKANSPSGLSTSCECLPAICGWLSPATADWHVSNFTAIEDFLRRVNCQQYLSKLQENEIDLPALMLMTDEDLRNVGITKIGARKKLINAIRKVKESSLGF